MSKILMKEAEALVPVKRAALYRHAKSGALSTSKNAQGHLIVDIAELQRYYGELNTNGTGRHNEKNEKDNRRQPETPKISENGHQHNTIQPHVLIELLQKQLSDTKSELADAKDREKQLLSMLKTEQEKTKMLMLPKPKKRFNWLGYFRLKK